MAAGVLLLYWCFCLPDELFRDVSYSTVVTDRNGRLLGARVAEDGQWRFPPGDSIPEKFAIALVEFEDRAFYRHPGVNPLALGRALWQNLRNGRIVSGGSTISMQVIRMSRCKPRTFRQKAIEICMATRLEMRYSKTEILRLYAAHAPFGGNVVGIEAAVWRYLGTDGSGISWAEAATLAVLQNAPSSIHPGKNREQLLAKRNRLLRRLTDRGYLSEFDYALSIEEPLIGKLRPMPQSASHFVERCHCIRPGQRTATKIELSLQERVEETTDRWSRELRLAGIDGLSAIIIDVESGETIAYCGNADRTFVRPGMYVDIAHAPRSSGSILKPLLYAAALQEGVLLPHALLPDIPTNFDGFAPSNFDGAFTGAVPADEALAQSLNIPFVHLLKRFGTMRLADRLKAGGLTSLRRPSDEYGLSLILGGAEVTLAETTQLYADMAAFYLASDPSAERFVRYPFTDKAALYHTFEALRKVNRPDRTDHNRLSSAQDIAWKTGTSYGSRDAWAIGITPRYAVGVWVGNADGGGVPGLTGARTAGPVLFDLFNLLPSSEWFAPPAPSEGITACICRRSGHLAGRDCTDTIRMLLPKAALQSPICPYCHPIPPAEDDTERNASVRNGHRFILPPVMEFYYKRKHPEYEPHPLLRSDTATDAMHFIYPTAGSTLSLPRQTDGTPGFIAISVAHSTAPCTVFWHLDDRYLGATREIHQWRIRPSAGHHRLTAVDENGATVSVEFDIREPR